MSSLMSIFFKDNNAGMTLRAAIFFGVGAVLLSVLAVPTLQTYSDQYAESRGYGIDHVMTGSIKKTKRYILHKSVLSKNAVHICANGEKKDAC